MRYLAAAIEQTLAERQMAFVSGPRQVGKTTLAKSLLPDPKGGYFTWDLDRDRRRILRADGAFWTAPPRGRTARLVLDEIHKYPRWKRLLKGLFDTYRDDVELIVMGSGRLDVYQKGGDSLFGRYQLHRLHPFTTGELLAGGRQTVLAPEEFDEAMAAPIPSQVPRKRCSGSRRSRGSLNRSSPAAPIDSGGGGDPAAIWCCGRTCAI